MKFFFFTDYFFWNEKITLELGFNLKSIKLVSSYTLLKSIGEKNLLTHFSGTTFGEKLIIPLWINFVSLVNCPMNLLLLTLDIYNFLQCRPRRCSLDETYDEREFPWSSNSTEQFDKALFPKSSFFSILSDRETRWSPVLSSWQKFGKL